MVIWLCASNVRADEVESFDGKIERGAVLQFQDQNYTLKMWPQKVVTDSGGDSNGTTTRVFPLVDAYKIDFYSTVGGNAGDIEVFSSRTQPPTKVNEALEQEHEGEADATPAPRAQNNLIGALARVFIGGAVAPAPPRDPLAVSSVRTATKGSIKLRAGMHKVNFITWTGDSEQRLRLRWSKTGEKSAEIPADRWFHSDVNRDGPPSGGIDEAGYRLPEHPEQVLPQLQYTTYQLPDPARTWTSGSEFARSLRTQQGLAEQISQKAGGVGTNVGLLFTGFIKIEEEGEYQFQSDGKNGRLVFGSTPRHLWDLPPIPADYDWSIVLKNRALIQGRLTAWNGERVECELAAGEDKRTLQIPVSEILGIHKADRAQPVGEIADVLATASKLSTSDEKSPRTAIICARNQDDKIQKLTGEILGIEADALLVKFQGQDRKIKLDRLIAVGYRAVALADQDQPAPAAPAAHVLTLSDGSVLPGTWISLVDGEMKFTTTWGQDVILSQREVSRIVVRNGKVLPLVAIAPASVEQTPYFNRSWNWQTIDESSLNPIAVGQGVDGQHSLCQEGLLVHSRTVLRYAIDGEFSSFRSQIGFLDGQGKLGNVNVRVKGDDRLLFEALRFSADQPPADIAVEVTGVRELVLEVDFGDGQDVGDRVVWISPRLVRTNAGAE